MTSPSEPMRNNISKEDLKEAELMAEEWREGYQAGLDAALGKFPDTLDTEGSFGKYPSGWNDALEQARENIGKLKDK